jgi:hypothetical protein
MLRHHIHTVEHRVPWFSIILTAAMSYAAVKGIDLLIDYLL